MHTQDGLAPGGHAQGALSTSRVDAWWSFPAATALGLTAFVVYTTWAALQGEHYYAAPYLSPFYSPVLFTDPSAPGAAPLSHAWFGAWPSWWPRWLPASPALLILIFPGAFRFTCYYYRKAYYRAFAGSPPACAVAPLATGLRHYRGETAWLLFQNLHRYALYFAIAFIFILGYDAILSFWRRGPDGAAHLGVGLGSLVLVVNVVLLAAYTFGCHSWRHLMGGRKDAFTADGRPTVWHRIWSRVTWLNERHMLFAWLSLFWVGFTDVYVRLVSMGVIADPNTWGY